MFTFEAKPRNGQTAAHTVVAIVLTDGTVAGEGIYHEERDYGMYRACMDAIDGGHYVAACGHAQQLTEADEDIIRRHASRLSVSRARVAAAKADATERLADELNAAAEIAARQVYS